MTKETRIQVRADRTTRRGMSLAPHVQDHGLPNRAIEDEAAHVCELAFATLEYPATEPRCRLSQFASETLARSVNAVCVLAESHEEIGFLLLLLICFQFSFHPSVKLICCFSWEIVVLSHVWSVLLVNRAMPNHC